MKTLSNPQAKLNIESFDNLIFQAKEELINSKIDYSSKFYQTLIIILLTMCTFLIFPESPQDSDILCKKYHSKEVCNIW